MTFFFLFLENNILVAKALVIIGNEVEGSVIKEGTQLLGLSLGLGPGDLGGHLDFANRRHFCCRRMNFCEMKKNQSSRLLCYTTRQYSFHNKIGSAYSVLYSFESCLVSAPPAMAFAG